MKLMDVLSAVIKTMKPGPAVEAPRKLSQTKRKALIRAAKTAPRASCDSFRYRQKHQAELRANRRREQNDRRHRRLSAASSSLRKTA